MKKIIIILFILVTVSAFFLFSCKREKTNCETCKSQNADFTSSLTISDNGQNLEFSNVDFRNGDLKNFFSSADKRITQNEYAQIDNLVNKYTNNSSETFTTVLYLETAIPENKIIDWNKVIGI